MNKLDQLADLSRQVDDLSERFLNLINKIDDTVREYPWIAIAAGIAFAGAVAFIAGSARAQHQSASRNLDG